MAKKKSKKAKSETVEDHNLAVEVRTLMVLAQSELVRYGEQSAFFRNDAIFGLALDLTRMKMKHPPDQAYVDKMELVRKSERHNHWLCMSNEDRVKYRHWSLMTKKTKYGWTFPDEMTGKKK